MQHPANKGAKAFGLNAVAAARRAQASQANRVKDGQSLGALRATATLAPPASRGLMSAGRADDGGDRRGTSLLDLPGSGQGLISRLRAQVRPSSPLNVLGGQDERPGALSSLSARRTESSGGLLSSLSIRRDDAPKGALSSLAARRPGGGLLSSLAGASGDRDGSGPLAALRRGNAQRSSLRSAFLANDNQSRLMLSAGSPLRTQGGFGLASINRSTISLFG